jgi:hypothetical protein
MALGRLGVPLQEAQLHGFTLQRGTTLLVLVLCHAPHSVWENLKIHWRNPTSWAYH